MSEASKARGARARAAIAERYIRGRKADALGEGFGRAFDDCFESGDGDRVVAILIKKAATDETFRRQIVAHGFGIWLEPGYLSNRTGQLQLFS